MDAPTLIVEATSYAVLDPLGDEGELPVTRAARDALRARLCEDGDPALALADANAAVLRACALHEMPGTGCSAAALSLVHPGARVAWLGNVHVVRLRGGELTELTRPHSLLNHLADQGAVQAADLEARAAFPRNVLVRALGMEAPPEIPTTVTDVRERDVFLLASNDLVDALGERRLLSILAAHGTDPHAGVRTLVETATDDGVTRQLTAVMVAILGAGPLAAARAFWAAGAAANVA